MKKIFTSLFLGSILLSAPAFVSAASSSPACPGVDVSTAAGQNACNAAVAADEQKGATDVQDAQAAATTAANDLTTVQQCAQGATQAQCQTSWTYAAATAAQQASQYAADAANIATKDAPAAGNVGSAVFTQIQTNSAQAQAAAASAEKSATQAASASGEATTANQESAATQSSAQAAGGSATAAQSTSGATLTAPSAGASANFVPLTSLPGLSTINNNSSGGGDLSSFLQTVYKVCVGVAAGLAVLQIMHAGIIWLTAGDSSEKVSSARHLISSSIIGLVLVLSPYIVFSIVNPSVLNLNLGFSSVAPTPTSITANDINTTLAGSTTPNVANSVQQALGDGTCQGIVDCNTGYTCSNKQCVPVSSVDTQCSDYDIDGEAVLPAGQTCATAYQDGDVTAPMSCCQDSSPSAGEVCCAHKN